MTSGRATSTEPDERAEGAGGVAGPRPRLRLGLASAPSASALGPRVGPARYDPRVFEAPSRRSALVACGVPALLVLVLRFLQVRSSAHLLYHGEFAGIARLFRWLDEDTLVWRGVPEFVHETTYQWFAQGTSLLQVLAWLLQPLFGRTLWGHWGAAALLEALAVLLFAGTLLRLTTPILALLGGLAVALPPNAVLGWNLQPYGNHNEFLWVPLGVACWLAGRDPEERRGSWVIPVLLLGLGIVLYRANVFAAAACVAAVGWPLGRRRVLPAGALAVGILGLAAATFTYLGLSPLGTTEGGLGSFPDPSIGFDRAARGLRAAVRAELPAFGGGVVANIHRVVLLGALLAAFAAGFGGADRRARVARFAGIWGLLAFAAPILSGNALGRYFVPGWYAAMLALACLLAGPHRLRRTVAVTLAASALGGLVAATPYITPSTWSRTRDLRGIELWFDLEVNSVDLDELPWYGRLLDEGRASRWIGWPSHRASAICPTNPGLHPQDRPDPTADTCSGWGPGELVPVLEDLARHFGHDVVGRTDALRDVGRGAWIRSNRSVPAVERAVQGSPGELRGPVLEGARDEASRWRDP